VTEIVIESESTGSPTAPVFTGPSRWLAASLFVIGAGLQVAEFLLEDLTDDNAVRTAAWLTHPATAAASMSLGLLAVPFLLGGFAVLVAITRRHSRRLATTAAALLSLAMVGLAAVHGLEIAAFSLATSGHPAEAAALLDGDQVVAPMVTLFAMFLPGAVLGSVTLALAIWRSPLLPRLTAIGVTLFAILDFALASPVVSHLVAFANSLLIAWAVVSGYSRRSARGAH
jgi:hypothetical protein